MAKNVSANMDDMRSAAKQLAHLADNIGQVATSLETSLAAVGTPWGDDKPGIQFAEGEHGYRKRRDGLCEAGQFKSKLLHEFADMLTKSADALDRNEQGSTDRLAR
ncbi:hypothetical protein [Nocardia sp. NPDC127526]|uniref:hypothetical protein n=1 Tax=Nocardia sp. NPDC127526 TaxID=3345393 RepID=UPI003631CFCC